MRKISELRRGLRKRTFNIMEGLNTSMDLSELDESLMDYDNKKKKIEDLLQTNDELSASNK